MSFNLNWKRNFNIKDNVAFIIIGPPPESLQITEQVKIYLDERFNNKKSLVYCCKNLEDLSDKKDFLIDFIVILIDITHHRTSEKQITKLVSKIDPRFMLNSRLIFVTVLKYSIFIDHEMFSFVNELSNKYGSIRLMGSTEEPEFVNNVAQSIAQHAYYVLKK